MVPDSTPKEKEKEDKERKKEEKALRVDDALFC